MPPSLPSINGRDVVRIFESLGWVVTRQSGSHMRAAGLTITEFVAAM